MVSIFVPSSRANAASLHVSTREEDEVEEEEEITEVAPTVFTFPASPWGAAEAAAAGGSTGDVLEEDAEGAWTCLPPPETMARKREGQDWAFMERGGGRKRRFGE